MSTTVVNPWDSYSVLSAFQQRTDLTKYDRNGLMLFALELALDIDDIDSVAASALTDGSDDKKCDLVFVNEDLRMAVVAQSYMAERYKPCAEANKASDLNTAASWLLNRKIEELPEVLKPAAADLRSALGAGKIDRLCFWYVHNCSEHENIKDELKTVELTALTALKAQFSDRTVQVEAMEIGLDRLQELFKAASLEILVQDNFELDVPGGYKIDSDGWRAFATAVPASWLFDTFAVNKDKLFSANVRGYLGSRKSDSNINENIKRSASESGSNFWAYNNGVTAIVNTCEFTQTNPAEQSGKLKISGLSIVNGAQTTGALGSLSSRPGGDVFVPARFITCSDSETVKEIIRFNNSQNKVAAADFRSTDRHQERLRKEFESLTGYNYRGGRRGGADDKIRRPSNLLSSDTVAQLLAAFHQNPQLAYLEKGAIWESDSSYAKYFNDSTTARHIVFLFALNEAIKNAKAALVEKSSQQHLSAPEKKSLEYLRYRGSLYFLVAAFGRTMETILNQSVASLFSLHFKETLELKDLATLWAPVVSIYLGLSEFLVPPVTDGLRRKEAIEEALKQFSALLAATALANDSIYRNFAGNVQT